MNQLYVNIIQLMIALGLINVWILRFNRKTAYRGGDASNLKEEFLVYGLPFWFFYLVGFLKISSAILLILGIYFPSLTLPASLLVFALMLGAIAMHFKVKDPIIKAVPASFMLIMSFVVICCLLPA